MSITTLTVQVAQPRSAPRLASALGSLFAAALNQASRLFSKSSGVSPREASMNAADVRALAYSMVNSNPGIASDLLAAVDRHESRTGQ